MTSSVPSSTSKLFHIAEQPFWDAARASGNYRAASLDAEGFIHLSTRAQFVATANRYYVGRNDLVLLEVDEAALEDLRYELSTNDESFPHLYGALPVSAVLGTHMFLPSADGTFACPVSLA
jgi:uncharacterized protein (DUF952 family)